MPPLIPVSYEIKHILVFFGITRQLNLFSIFFRAASSENWVLLNAMQDHYYIFWNQDLCIFQIYLSATLHQSLNKKIKIFAHILNSESPYSPFMNRYSFNKYRLLCLNFVVYLFLQFVQSLIILLLWNVHHNIFHYE